MDPEYENLLNLVQPLNVSLLEQIVSIGTNPVHPHFEMATGFLMKFRENSQSWTAVPVILESATNLQTIRFSLQILNNLVAHRWSQVPNDEKTSIREFIIQYILRLSSTDEMLQSSKLILDAANLVLVEIVRQDWPSKWPKFIDEILEASKVSNSTCENNMVILSLLSEEVFDFSKNRMTKAKTQLLKDQLVQQFSPIYSFCELILSGQTQSESLLRVTLEALLRFITWIPLGYVFETQLTKILIYNYFTNFKWSNYALSCLVEIASIPNDDVPPIKFQTLFADFMAHLPKSCSPETNFAVMYSQSQVNAMFLQRVALFLTNFFKLHLMLVETSELAVPLKLAHDYLIGLSSIKDKDLFLIILEYWHFLCESLYKEVPIRQHVPVVTHRRTFYAPILSKLRVIIITNMAKPEEILVLTDDTGNVLREHMNNTENLELHKLMHSCLVYLANLDLKNTLEIINQKLNQINARNFNERTSCTLCWAIGSISGVMSETEERNFFIKVIVKLIDLCGVMKSKDSRAIIASNVMYVVGQYPRFLALYWTFLKTVVIKLFEWMREPHPGVQDMACDTFLKLVHTNAPQFLKQQRDNSSPVLSQPYIDTMLEHIPSLIEMLEDRQVTTFYEAISVILQAEKDVNRRKLLLQNLMKYSNATWRSIISQSTGNSSILKNMQTIKTIIQIIRINHAVCKHLKQGFEPQLSEIFFEMLNIYKYYSEDMATMIRTNGSRYLNSMFAKAQRSVKQNILNLISCFVQSTDKPESVLGMIDALLQLVLREYVEGVPESRDPEVLALLTELVNKCGELLIDKIDLFFDAVFKPTVDMIVMDMSEYPEHRIQFFRFIRSVNQHCFKALMALPPDSFDLVINVVDWALRHTMNTVSQLGLSVLNEMLENVERENLANEFYERYFLPLTQELFSIMTDGLHKLDFPMHAKTLLIMFSAIKRGVVNKPLHSNNGTAYPNNTAYLLDYSVNLFSHAFPNLSPTIIRETTLLLISNCHDYSAFKSCLRDFLVQIKEFSDTEDNSLLEFEDREAEKAEAAAKLMKEQLLIPGMINSNDSELENLDTTKN